MANVADFGLKLGRQPFPLTNLYIFTVTSNSPSVGATYTNNGNTFTNLAVGSSATTVYMLGTGNPAAATGTLTQATGTGGDITFSAYTNAVLEQNRGAAIYVANSGLQVTTATQVAALFSTTNNNPPFDVSEPAVGSIVISNGVLGQYGVGSIWFHSATGTTSAAWTGLTASSGSLASMITDVTATYGELNGLASSGITAAKAASAFGSAGKVVHTCYTTTATYAQLNAGLTLVAAPGTGIILTPISFSVIVNGATAWADCTALVLKDTSATVTIATIPVASLSGYCNVTGPSSTVSLGTGYRGALTTNNGIMAITTGTIESHGSQILIKVDYVI